MPLFKTLHPNSQTCVKIWHIQETYESLNKDVILRVKSKARLDGMKSEVHQRGFLSVRHLLASFGYTDHDLFYDEFGKPHLKDGKHISITHSFEYSGMIISDQPVGIDIEKQRNKISLIAKKFIDYEFQYLDNQDDYIRKLTVIWCIKESLYKLFATPGLSFKKHTLVLPFALENESTKSWIDYRKSKNRFHADYLEFNGFTCAYTLKG